MSLRRYKLFLDKTWMYSSGVFNSPTDSLYDSQVCGWVCGWVGVSACVCMYIYIPTSQTQVWVCQDQLVRSLLALIVQKYRY